MRDDKIRSEKFASGQSGTRGRYFRRISRRSAPVVTSSSIRDTRNYISISRRSIWTENRDDQGEEEKKEREEKDEGRKLEADMEIAGFW